MMSRFRGEGVTQSMTNSTDRLRECVTKGGRGSKKVENLRDVIYGWSLIHRRFDVSSALVVVLRRDIRGLDS